MDSWAQITYILIYNKQKSPKGDRHATSVPIRVIRSWFFIRNGLQSRNYLCFDILDANINPSWPACYKHADQNDQISISILKIDSWAKITYILILDKQKSPEGDRHSTSWLLARRSECCNRRFDPGNGFPCSNYLYFDVSHDAFPWKIEINKHLLNIQDGARARTLKLKIKRSLTT